MDAPDRPESDVVGKQGGEFSRQEVLQQTEQRVHLGGWALPFFHRDGITIAFGESELFHTRMPHIWMIIFGILTFFGKTVVVCLFQAFVRWSLPRFRYDQVMKIGWQKMLPLSIANLLFYAIAIAVLQK